MRGGGFVCGCATPWGRGGHGMPILTRFARSDARAERPYNGLALLVADAQTERPYICGVCNKKC